MSGYGLAMKKIKRFYDRRDFYIVVNIAAVVSVLLNVALIRLVTISHLVTATFPVLILGVFVISKSKTDSHLKIIAPAICGLFAWGVVFECGIITSVNFGLSFAIIGWFLGMHLDARRL